MYGPDGVFPEIDLPPGMDLNYTCGLCGRGMGMFVDMDEREEFEAILALQCAVDSNGRFCLESLPSRLASLWTPQGMRGVCEEECGATTFEVLRISGAFDPEVQLELDGFCAQVPGRGYCTVLAMEILTTRGPQMGSEASMTAQDLGVLCDSACSEVFEAMGVVENLAMLCATDIGGQRCARKLQAEEQLRNARNQFEVGIDQTQTWPLSDLGGMWWEQEDAETRVCDGCGWLRVCMPGPVEGEEAEPGMLSPAGEYCMMAGMEHVREELAVACGRDDQGGLCARSLAPAPTTGPSSNMQPDPMAFERTCGVCRPYADYLLLRHGSLADLPIPSGYKTLVGEQGVAMGLGSRVLAAACAGGAVGGGRCGAEEEDPSSVLREAGQQRYAMVQDWTLATQVAEQVCGNRCVQLAVGVQTSAMEGVFGFESAHWFQEGCVYNGEDRCLSHFLHSSDLLSAFRRACDNGPGSMCDGHCKEAFECQIGLLL